MARTVLKASYSAGQDALENFDTLATYAATGARKAKRRAHESGHSVTIIKDGTVVEVAPDGHTRAVRDVAAVGKFEPLVAG
jgi:hypothetical protein